MANQARSPVGGAEDSTRPDDPQRSEGCTGPLVLSIVAHAHTTGPRAALGLGIVVECGRAHEFTGIPVSPLPSVRPGDIGQGAGAGSLSGGIRPARVPAA